MKQTCIACQSTDLIADVAVVDRGEGNGQWRLTLATYENPEAWVFKGQKTAEAKATVCRNCGYVMLYVTRNGISELDLKN